MSSLPVVERLVRTSYGSPSQWLGRLEDARFLDVRYCHGVLTAGIGSTEDNATWSRINQPCFRGQCDYAPVTDTELHDFLGHLFDFSKVQR